MYSYRVASYTETGNNEASSGWVTGCTQPAPLGGQAFQAEWVSLPAAPWAQPEGQGHWLLWPVSVGAQSYGVVDWSPAGATEKALLWGYPSPSTPPVVLDASSQPHVAYVDSSFQLVHGWRSASGWQTEVVAQDADRITSLGYEGLPFLVGPDGSLSLCFARRGTGKACEAVRGAAGWTVAEDPHLARLSGFALDPSGALWGVECGWAGPEVPRPLILWSRGGDGAWSSRPVPGDGTLSQVAFAMGPDGAAHLVFVKAADAAGGQGLVHIAQQGPGWSQPEYLTSESPDPNRPQYLTLPSQDGRPFFSAEFQEGTVLFTRDEAGAWSRSTLLPSNAFPAFFIQGRAADGRLFLVVWPSTGLLTGAAVFTQPRP
ncbi:MAG TPA: hypothetical protein VK188_06840 [Holophaga sp.]|nr:hypothetical protein [Holophaga sp.]